MYDLTHLPSLLLYHQRQNPLKLPRSHSSDGRHCAARRAREARFGHQPLPSASSIHIISQRRVSIASIALWDIPMAVHQYRSLRGKRVATIPQYIVASPEIFDFRNLPQVVGRLSGKATAAQGSSRILPINAQMKIRGHSNHHRIISRFQVSWRQYGYNQSWSGSYFLLYTICHLEHLFSLYRLIKSRIMSEQFPALVSLARLRPHRPRRT
jgi:hypothetical protein